MINDTEKRNTKIINNLNELQKNFIQEMGEGLPNKVIIEDLNVGLKNIKNIVHHFYDFPRYYDKAFSRDVKSDILFFIRCFQQYSEVEVKRVLESACGPGMFLEALPQFGFYALGYDLSPAMVGYSKERLKNSGLSTKDADAIEGNMTNIKFDEKFDAAFICINSLGYLSNEDDILAHFRVMGDSIKRGGLYIVEISCKCDDLRNEKKFDDTWYVKEDGMDIESTWAVNWYDIERRIRHVDFHMIINENGNKEEISEAHELRLWVFDEFKQFAKLSGFKIVGIYNQNYEKIAENVPITGELGALFFVLQNIG